MSCVILRCRVMVATHCSVDVDVAANGVILVRIRYPHDFTVYSLTLPLETY